MAERDLLEQSRLACCPRETIPDSCSCPDGCECQCLDCDCDDELDNDERRYCASCDAEIPWDAWTCPGCGGDA